MMMNRKKPASLHEAIRNLWKIRIMLEKNYTENCATWMAKRIESLIDHMQYGHALIAYHRQDGTFRLVRATLLPYKNMFRLRMLIINHSKIKTNYGNELWGNHVFPIECEFL